MITGVRRSGVLIRVDGVPCATALAEITATPLGMDLPARVSGEVICHAAHNHQVKVRLDEWRAADE